MKVRERNDRIVSGGKRDAIFKAAALDLYLVNGNKTLCYEIYRRLVTGDLSYKVNRGNANKWFDREDNVEYLRARGMEVDRQGFERHAATHDLDISEIQKKEDRYYDIENLTPDELRVKNLAELEDIKNATDDMALQARVIEQQTNLMNAKRRDEESKNTDLFINYILPYPECPSCGVSFSTVPKSKKDALKE